MGLYDTLTVSNEAFKCSEGHDLSEAEFQTKDLGQTMGYWQISDVLTGEPGGWGRPLPKPISGVLEIYCACIACPAFVQAGTGNLVDCAVTFAVEIHRDKVVRVERQGMTTKEWLAYEPAQVWMKECEGPMSWQAAYVRHAQYHHVRREPHVKKEGTEV